MTAASSLDGHPAADEVARFRTDTLRLKEEEGLLGLAVSGGPDSLALLLLARAAFPGRIAAATVDHRLRPEAADEARHVARICADLGCPHDSLAVDVEDRGGGVQGDARRARYAALARWAGDRGIATLATAHHADDQAETLLMRLRRGAGIAGLSGIRPVRLEGEELRIIRPLLGWRKGDLLSIVARSGLGAIDDPSNRDMRFDRTAVRKLLQDNPDFDPRRLSRSADAVREADEALAWAADRLWQERAVDRDGAWLIDVADLPRHLRRRLAQRAITRLHDRGKPIEPWSEADDIEGLLSALEAGGAATRAGIAATGGGTWRFRLAPPRRNGR